MGFSLTTNDLKRVAYAAAFAFIGAFAPLAAGSAQWHNYSDAKAAFLALIPAAISAGLSALKNGFLSDGSTLKG